MAAIMVVEDERVVARDIQESLEQLGYDVLGTAASAEECLRYASARRPDLVLMDVRIDGDIDGIGAAKLLRERYDIPVIFLTAYADQRTVSRARESQLKLVFTVVDQMARNATFSLGPMLEK